MTFWRNVLPNILPQVQNAVLVVKKTLQNFYQCGLSSFPAEVDFGPVSTVPFLSASWSSPIGSVGFELSWRIFSSAQLMAFSTSAQNQKIGRKEPKFDCQLKTNFWITFVINKLLLKITKLCSQIMKSYYSTLKIPSCYINSDEWLWKWLESCYRSKIGKFESL